ncbi:hypothetical protein IT396_01435 [Candidatus Nomurabacteria bacterium]|nr:hypothetical protein [Candidatus Nomurabacteria bacterium]
MIKIIPAILPKTFDELVSGLERLSSVSNEIQIDLVGRNVLKDQEMPHWQEFEFEIDVMLPEPHTELDSILALGPSRIVIHAANQHAKEALTQLQSMRDGNYPTLVGIALLPTAEPEVLDEYAGLYDFIQVMGIDEVGAQGRPFNPKAIELVSRLRALHPQVLIQVDGHAAGNEKELVAAGAERLVIGSAILNADNPKAALHEALARANAGV